MKRLSRMFLPLVLLAPHAPAAPAPTPIGRVQGSVGDGDNGATHRSPMQQQPVTVQAVVHQMLGWRSGGGRPQYGLLLQNTAQTADGDPRSSDGILVYLGEAPVVEAGREDFRPRPGDELLLTAMVGEYHGFTQLKDARLEGAPLRRALDLDREVPPVDANPPADAAEAARYWERLEGMRVRLPAGLRCVSGRGHNPRNDDAEIWVVRGDSPVGARTEAAARRVFRDAHPLDDLPAARDNGNGFRFALSSMGVKGARGHEAYLPPARTFDTLTSPVTGGVLYSFAAYQVAPVAPPTLQTGPAPDTLCAPQAPQPRSFLAAAYNMENLYDARNDPSDPCDDARDPGNESVTPPFDYVPASAAAYQDRVRKLARQVVEDLHAPDLLLLAEIEDQDICAVRDGALVDTRRNHADGRLDALQDLSLAIRAAGGPAYDCASDRDGADARGITCAFLFRTDRVRLAAVSAGDPVLGARPAIDSPRPLLPYAADVQNPKAINAEFTPVDPGDNDPPRVFTRAVQVAHFEVFRERLGEGPAQSVFALANHFTSRPDRNLTRRAQQAALAAAVADAAHRAHPGALVLVGGDLNTFPRPDEPVERASDTLGALYRAGLHNLYDRVLAERPACAYSYVHAGETGTLDHLFIDAAHTAAVRQAAYLHLNADWPAGLEDGRARGLSDHDVIWAEVRLFD